MDIIFTLDDDNGTRLADKRQSKDRIVGEQIIALADGHLHMAEESVSFFKHNSLSAVPYVITDNIAGLPKDAVFFAERVLPDNVMNAAEHIYVFRWNRRYPSFAQDRVCLDGYAKVVLGEFKGHSHDKITLEVYSR